MKISEIFYSIQGEGKLSGVASVFVRVSGCNLRCAWCDTPYASWQAGGVEMGVEEIVGRVVEYGAGHVVLTGGEPVIMPEVVALAEALKRAGMHLTVETAGTVFQAMPLDLASVSPKLSNSTPYQREGGRFAAVHEAHRVNVEVIQRFIDGSPDFQLKFVVAGESDVPEIQGILGKLSRWSPADVLLMPEGTEPGELQSKSEWIVEVCKETGFRFCPRLHVMLYGNRRGV